MLSKQEIAGLRELLAKATPGPWNVKTTGNIGNQIEAYRGRKDPNFMDDGMRSVASFQYCGPSDNYYEQQEVCAATGDLIAAAVNALPALLDIAEAVDAAPVAEIDSSGGLVELIAEGSALDNAITSARIDAMHGQRVRLLAVDAGEVGNGDR